MEEKELLVRDLETPSFSQSSHFDWKTIGKTSFGDVNDRRDANAF